MMIKTTIQAINTPFDTLKQYLNSSQWYTFDIRVTKLPWYTKAMRVTQIYWYTYTLGVTALIRY